MVFHKLPLIPVGANRGVGHPPNAAPEWQARSWGGEAQSLMAAWPLEGLVGRPLRLSKQLFKFTSRQLNITQYLCE